MQEEEEKCHSSMERSQQRHMRRNLHPWSSAAAFTAKMTKMTAWRKRLKMMRWKKRSMMGAKMKMGQKMTR